MPYSPSSQSSILSKTLAQNMFVGNYKVTLHFLDAKLVKNSCLMFRYIWETCKKATV